ncbi:ATP-binding cassette domain-containing protein [Paucibacter sp. APW11]|uniref:ATP-binding cassette domain-containing protein n=1 Tax=Roseateles aquae TaxID=3077235 RepID=A0ABU3PEP0_9BURK|nr:ATP-binding cassette domain-containing protein [Paucibacter sp. APW11]MDT9001054.1 ATP-binding cassette domain-containing protein [Paucibacter sp. APW11]
MPDKRLLSILPPPLLCAEALTLAFDGQPPLFGPLSFAIGPGLSLVRGGDGRGKSSLLRLLAGRLAPSSGRLQRTAATLWDEDINEADQQTVAAAWLAAQRARHAGWDRAAEPALLTALGLDEHLAKPLYMHSMGSRRKVGLAGALLSGAALTLIDMPFAALDARSIRVLCEQLAQQAQAGQRALVIADYALPAALQAQPLAALIELGD